MDIEAIDRSIEDALSTFAMRGVEVTGYSGDASVPCGWLFQFSTCWRFDGQIATVRVRCTLVAGALGGYFRGLEEAQKNEAHELQMARQRLELERQRLEIERLRRQTPSEQRGFEGLVD